MKKKLLSYKRSGVNRNQADLLVKSIGGWVGKTLNSNVASHVGGYASIYKFSKDQWIAASTDGVGTKLKLAFEWKMHDGVGEDLVAMSVNDLLCVGAKPLFFLDYFATGRLQNNIAGRVIQSIARGCQKGGVALVGGETAEMPGFYNPGEYDLAGFAVGSVNPKAILPKKKISPDAYLIGVESSGFHSNGYSLVREILKSEKVDAKLKKNLLAPTLIYSKLFEKLIKDNLIEGASHITGSGFLNLPRISTAVEYDIELPKLSERAYVYSWLHKLKRISFQESCQTFNQGIGMILVVRPENAKKVIQCAKKTGYRSWVIGKTKKKRSALKLKNTWVSVSSKEEGEAQLFY